MGLSVGGLISGLDTQTIVEKLMELERRPIDLLKNREQNFQVKLTAYGRVKSALSQLQDAVDDLSDEDTFFATTATSSNEDILTVSGSTSAQEGNHVVLVKSLARAHSVRSAAFTSSTDTVGTGTISIQVGSSDAVDVVIDTEHQTLSGIATAINDADAGVYAGVVDDGMGNVYLTLTADQAGSDNTISTSITNGDSGQLDSLYEHKDLKTTQEASNSRLTVDGIDVERSTNVITDLIPGVTMTLHKVDKNQSIDISISRDTDSIREKIDALVEAYNSVADELSSEQSYAGEGGISGTLIGDPTIRSITQQMARLLGKTVDGAETGFDTLFDIGISTDRYGKIQVDESDLADALEQHLDDVRTLFAVDSGTNQGVAVSLSEYLDGILDPADGAITAKEDAIQNTINFLQDRQQVLEDRLSKKEEILWDQFNSLELLLSNYQQTSDYLTRQLLNLNSSSSQLKS